MGVPICDPIPVHAIDRSGLLGIDLFRQHDVSARLQLLLCGHLPGLQWSVDHHRHQFQTAIANRCSFALPRQD